MEFVGVIIPIFLILALGKALTLQSFIDEPAWNAIERLVLYVLLPALIVRVLASVEFEWSAVKLIGVLIVAQILMALIGYSARNLSKYPGPSTASIIQSNVRFNTFIGLSIAATLFGDEGLALFAIVAAGMIPTANLISISAFETLADEPGTGGGRAIAVIQNPLIIACIVGGLLGAADIKLPEFTAQTLELLSQAAIALGLLCAGAALNFSSLKKGAMTSLLWSVVRLFGFPLIVIGLAFAFELSGPAKSIAIIAAVTPTSTSGVILASQLRGDSVLAANLIAIQTLLCVISIPLLLYVWGVS